MTRRVHELARELQVESKIVLQVARELGLFLKSASSTLTEIEVARIRRKLQVDRVGPMPGLLPPRPGPLRSARVAHTQPDEPASDPEDALRRYLGVRTSSGRHRPSSRQPRSPRGPRSAWSHAPLTGLAAEIAGRWPNLGDEEARRCERQWLSRWMELADAVVWFEAGLGPYEAELVVSFQEAGLRPDHLGLIIDGRTAIRIYRDHRSIGQLVAALRAAGYL